MVKKIITRVVVLLFIFLAAVFVIGKVVNRDMPDTTEEMAEAALPLVYMLNGETQMNCLHGYVTEMEVTALRDALTPLQENRSLQIQIQPYQKQVSSIRFEVLTSDGKTSLENTKVTKIEEGGDYLNAQLELQNKILMNTEYMLKIALTAGEEEIYYYTRIIQEDGLNVDSYLEFVNDFYENCLAGNDLNIEEFVEPDPTVETTSFTKIDIHSNLDMIIWKGLSPQIYFEPTPCIRELNENTCTIVMDYMISSNNEENETELYHVNEYYRMRHTDSRIMLLDFERDTVQIFNPENTVLTEKGISLGISNKEVTYKSDAEGNFFAFALEGALWLYDVSGNRFSRVFSFPQETSSDVRDMYRQNDIQIINIDEQGNLYFLVCGYMNRGNHEGEAGVAVYSYDALGNIISECLFVDTKQAYALLKEDVQDLAYVSEDRSRFCLMVAGEVYNIDMNTREVSSIVSGLSNGCYASSTSGRQFAWTEENSLYDSSTIDIIDLESQVIREITSDSQERVRILGFVGEDLVYGLAAEDVINASSNTNVEFPMNRLLIVKEDGEIGKDYTPAEGFISEVVIEDRLITVQMVRKSGNQYEELQEDHIVNSAASEETVFGFTSSSNERQKEIEILKVGTSLDGLDMPAVLKSQEMIYEGSKSIVLEPREEKREGYYVYAKGGLEGVYLSASQAIQKADEALGVVVDSSQQTIWERGNKQTKLDLNVDGFPQAFLQYSLDVNALQSQMEETVLDLTGCTLDEVLYFVSEGMPVLAKTPEGVVIIGGYDEYNTRLLYQGDTELTYYGLQDSTAMFEEAGNVFISYLNPLAE